MLCEIVFGFVCVPVERAEISIHASPVGSQAEIQMDQVSAVIELSSDQDIDTRELRQKACKGSACVDFRSTGYATADGRYLLEIELAPRGEGKAGVVTFIGRDRASTTAVASKFAIRIHEEAGSAMWAMGEFVKD
jgi:hypothetical protein